MTPDQKLSPFDCQEKGSQALPRKVLRIGHGNTRHYSHLHFIFKICFCFSSTLKLQLSPFILQNHLQIPNWRLSLQRGKVYPDLMFVYHKCSCSPLLSTLVAFRILLCLMPENLLKGMLYTTFLMSNHFFNLVYFSELSKKTLLLLSNDVNMGKEIHHCII